MSKKYIIEIEDTPYMAEEGNTSLALYKADGFNSLVFDQNGLDKLTPYDEESAYAEGYTLAESKYREVRDQVEREAYQRGLDAAWGAARKFFLAAVDGGYSTDEMDACFGKERESYTELIKNNTASEIVEKIREYEERKAKEDEIKVGDEIRNIHSGQRVIVTRVLNSGNYFNAVGIRSYDKKFGTWDDQSVSNWKKTGRHVELSELFLGEEE